MKEIDFRYHLLPLKNKLFRLALRILMDTAEAEDVVEDTLIKLWERRAELPALDSLEAYALTACRHLALDRSQAPAATAIRLDDAPADTADSGPLPDERAARADRLAWVRQLFRGLPERQRSVMHLRDVEGRSYAEIAQIMGMTQDQVRVTLFRARQSIRQQYEKIEQHGL